MTNDLVSQRERIERLSIPEPNSGCWIWLGKTEKSAGGHEYGRMTVGSRGVNRRTAKAHRHSYEVYKGEIPKGLFVCHDCDVSLCVNPDHLFLGTASRNTSDAYKRGLALGRRGAGLTKDNVSEASRRRSAGESWRSLGRRFGVFHETIMYAVQRYERGERYGR